MARQKAFYLSVIDKTNTTVKRWQQGYPNQTIYWQGEPWQYLSMEVDGISSGDPANLNVTVKLPRIASVWPTLEESLANGWRFLLQQYEFDALRGQSQPQADQRLVHTHSGELERLQSLSIAEAKLEIGSPVARRNTQLLPTTLTVNLIGTGIF